MKITVIDIFDINEEEAYFDISFLLQMHWYDHEITFQFLKNNLGEKQNYVFNKTIVNPIQRIITSTNNDLTKFGIQKFTLKTL